MNTQALTFAVIGFLLGGLVVSVAAVGFDDDDMGHRSTDSSMTMNGMTMDLTGKTGDDFDATFISRMIEHHEGAIAMAQLADKNAKHPEIKELSRNIISAQQSEITEMKQWQTDWGYDASQRDMMGH